MTKLIPDHVKCTKINKISKERNELFQIESPAVLRQIRLTEERMKKSALLTDIYVNICNRWKRIQDCPLAVLALKTPKKDAHFAKYTSMQTILILLA